MSMVKLACGTRGCWPVLVKTEEKTTTTTETVMASAEQSSIEQVWNTQLIIELAVILALSIAIFTTVLTLYNYKQLKNQVEKCKTESNELLNAVITSAQYSAVTKNIDMQ